MRLNKPLQHNLRNNGCRESFGNTPKSASPFQRLSHLQRVCHHYLDFIRPGALYHYYGTNFQSSTENRTQRLSRQIIMKQTQISTESSQYYSPNWALILKYIMDVLSSRPTHSTLIAQLTFVATRCTRGSTSLPQASHSCEWACTATPGLPDNGFTAPSDSVLVFHFRVPRMRNFHLHGRFWKKSTLEFYFHRWYSSGV